MMKKITMIACLLWAGFQWTTAQNVIKGKVVDHDGNPVAGAKVMNAKGSEQTTTDMNGKFALETEGEVKKLNIYCIGLQTAHKKVEPDMTIKMNNTGWWNDRLDSYRWFLGVEAANCEGSKFKPSLGAMFGIVKDWGWYMKGVYKKAEGKHVTLADDQFQPTGKTKAGYWAVSTGVMRRMVGNLYLYTGVGYFNRPVSWEYSNGEYYSYEPDEYKGVMVDLGLMLRVKHFFMNAGGSYGFKTGNIGCYDNDKKAVANFGLGVVF